MMTTVNHAAAPADGCAQGRVICYARSTGTMFDRPTFAITGPGGRSLFYASTLGRFTEAVAARALGLHRSQVRVVPL